MADFDVQSDVFENSPLAEVYYIVRSELEERDPKKRKRPWHHTVALWVAWESHKIAHIDAGTGGDLLAMVGLPKTQKELSTLLNVSTRTLRNYAMTYSDLVATARESGVQRILGLYDQHALHALGMMASTPTPQAASDRRTFFTMRGYLTDKTDLTSGGKEIAAPIIYMPDNGRNAPQDSNGD